MSRFYGRGKSYSHYRQAGRRKKVRRVLVFLVLFFLLVNFTSLYLIRSYRAVTVSMEPALPEGARFFATGIPYGVKLSPANIRLPGFREPRRGDLVVLEPPYIQKTPWYQGLLDGTVRFFTLQKAGVKASAKKDWENEELVKRVVGIPGDTLRIENYRVSVKPAGGGRSNSGGLPTGGQPAGGGRFFDEREFYPDSTILFPEFPPGWDPGHPFSGNLPVPGNLSVPGGLREFTLGESEYFVLSDNRGRGSDSLDWGPVDRDRIGRKVIFRYWPKPGFRF